MDANVLLYAVNRSTTQHQQAKGWLEQALHGTEAIGFSWTVLLAFVRLATFPALFPSPLASSDAFDLVDDWLGASAAMVVQPSGRHAALLHGLLGESGTAGNLVNDAHLAALAVELGARICTFDRDFNRFPGVKAFSPPKG